MDSLINAVKDTPLPNILVVAGIFFLLLTVVSQFMGKITVAPDKQKWAGIIGTLLLILGIALQVIPIQKITEQKTRDAKNAIEKVAETKEAQQNQSQQSQLPRDTVQHDDVARKEAERKATAAQEALGREKNAKKKAAIEKTAEEQKIAAAKALAEKAAAEQAVANAKAAIENARNERIRTQKDADNAKRMAQQEEEKRFRAEEARKAVAQSGNTVADTERSKKVKKTPITNIVFDPPTGTVLHSNQRVNFSFSYWTTQADGVRIFVRPQAGGRPAPNYGASGSPLYPTGSGSGNGFFTIRSGNVTVDGVSVKMVDPGQQTVLFDRVYPVSFEFRDR